MFNFRFSSTWIPTNPNQKVLFPHLIHEAGIFEKTRNHDFEKKNRELEPRAKISLCFIDGRSGGRVPNRGAIFVIFRKKNAILTPFGWYFARLSTFEKSL